MNAASVEPFESEASMSTKGTNLIVTSSFETPPAFSHLRTPMCAIVLGAVDEDRLADEVAGAS